MQAQMCVTCRISGSTHVRAMRKALMRASEERHHLKVVEELLNGAIRGQHLRQLILALGESEKGITRQQSAPSRLAGLLPSVR